MPVVDIRPPVVGKAVQLCLAVKFAPCEPSLCGRRLVCAIDKDAFHARHIDHQAIVDHGKTCSIVSTTMNRRVYVLLDRESNSRADICRAGAMCNRSGPAINHRVPDSARRIIIRRPGRRYLTTKLSFERLDVHGRLLKR